ncbi:hypothetical protein HNQ77_002683 [Silvibacterium bohemicum]|uniref:Uncharacterized protein n=1 Tax=Silvibacterium bohemicum TaxID=1577686 RepID=A0A841JW94_9BACT|nr:hypothetical protein [Silvibacterium bohemicum]
MSVEGLSLAGTDTRERAIGVIPSCWSELSSRCCSIALMLPDRSFAISWQTISRRTRSDPNNTSGGTCLDTSFQMAACSGLKYFGAAPSFLVGFGSYLR